jgi:hypothetical protein
MCWKQKTLEGKEGRVGTNYLCLRPAYVWSGTGTGTGSERHEGKVESQGKGRAEKGGCESSRGMCEGCRRMEV